MRSVFTVIGPLFIVAATIIFLRGIGDVIPPLLGAGLAFAAGLALLWLGFKPRQDARTAQTTPSEFAEGESYASAAMARLQESTEPPRGPSRTESGVQEQARVAHPISR